MYDDSVVEHMVRMRSCGRYFWVVAATDGCRRWFVEVCEKGNTERYICGMVGRVKGTKETVFVTPERKNS